MLTEDYLKEILCQKGINTADQIRLILASMNRPARPIEIRKVALSCGARKLGASNPSAWLCKMPDVRQIPEGWELGIEGKRRVTELTSASTFNLNVLATASKLRKLLSEIKNSDTQNFVQEALICFENHQYRAAVILSWVGALSIIQDYIVSQRLDAFNVQAAQHPAYKKWKPATERDGIAEMKEKDFLTVLHSMGAIGKSLKQGLEECLNRRNGCGHPNSVKYGEHTVTSHLEFLLENVYIPFSVQHPNH